MSTKIKSQPTYLKGKLNGAWDIDIERINATRVIGNGNIIIKGEYYAKNGTEIGPGIDIQFVYNMRIYNNRLIINAHITGNEFPAQETMIFDSKGTGLFLGVSTAKGNPNIGVWGS